MFAFCFQRDFANSFTKDFSEGNWKLSHSSKHLVTDFCKTSISMLMELFRKNYWKFSRNSKFYRTSSKICLTGSVTFASFVNRRIFSERESNPSKIFSSCHFLQIWANYYRWRCWNSICPAPNVVSKTESLSKLAKFTLFPTLSNCFWTGVLHSLRVASGWNFWVT